MVVIVLIALILFGIGYSFYKKALEYTSTESVTIPIHEIDQERFKELSLRMAAFKKAYDSNQPASLELTADDINTFIAMSPDLKDAKGKVYVRIEEGLIHLDGSIPLDKIAGFRGRYVNGTAAFEVSVTDGKLRLIPQKLVLNGKTLPKDIEREMKKSFEEGLQQELDQDPKTREVLQRIKSAAIDKNKLMIFTEPAAARASPPPQAPQSTTVEEPLPVKPSEAPKEVPLSSARKFTCPRQIAAYNLGAPSVPAGHFLAGTELEIEGPSNIPGMTQVRYRDPKSGTVSVLLCKSEDLAPQ